LGRDSQPQLSVRSSRYNIGEGQITGEILVYLSKEIYKVYIPELDRTGFISGFTNKWVYIQEIDGSYLQLNRKYKQINPGKIKLICRNNNYIYMENKSNHRKDSPFIST